ncbi:hypothetical protein [Altibacter sp.]|uniref:hypothetical protein n=1 Tax=Altibacter sp. TaxID=2024823 RepID=UPI0025C470B6|nr:hypothetical protein [Altibacter sp.]
MSEEEGQALINKFDIYLLPFETDVKNIIRSQESYAADFPFLRTKLKIGGGSHLDILNYTIDPRDYNMLMSIKSRVKTRLFVKLMGVNEFNLELFYHEEKIIFPIPLLKKLGYNTKSSHGSGSILREVNLQYANEGPSGAEKEIILENIVNHFDSSLVDIFSDERFEDQVPVEKRHFSFEFEIIRDKFNVQISYNYRVVTDSLTKLVNVDIPNDFYEGLERYFTPKSMKYLSKKIRSLINRRGDRKSVEDYIRSGNTPARLYFTDSNSRVTINEDVPYINDAISVYLFQIKDIILDYYKAKETLSPPNLPDNYFSKVKENFIRSLDVYFQTKGFSRPLTIGRLKSNVISREISTMLNTVISSSLPGFYTSSGTQRGFDFMKAVPEDIKFMENIIQDTENSIKLSERYLEYTIPPDAQLSRSVIYALQNIGQPIIKSSGTSRKLVIERIPRIFHLTGPVTMSEILSYKELEQIEGKTPRELMEELVKIVIPLDKVSTFFEAFEREIKEVVMKEGGASLNDVNEPPLQEYQINFSIDEGYDSYIITMRIKSQIIIRFHFSYDTVNSDAGPPRPRIFPYVSNLTLEKVSGSYIRLKTRSRDFEIDINASSDFYLEASKAVRRILIPQNFLIQQEILGTDRNPAERSISFLRNIIKGLVGKAGSQFIEVKPFIYDALTGARRGLYFAISESSPIHIYISVDDRKSGAARVSGAYPKIKGSACVGTFMVVDSRTDYLGAEKINLDFKGRTYNFYMTNSSCVNLDFQLGIDSIEGGENLDALGTMILAGSQTGTRFGEKIPENIAAFSRQAYIPYNELKPTFSETLRTGGSTKLGLSFSFVIKFSDESLYLVGPGRYDLDSPIGTMKGIKNYIIENYIEDSDKRQKQFNKAGPSKISEISSFIDLDDLESIYEDLSAQSEELSLEKFKEHIADMFLYNIERNMMESKMSDAFSVVPESSIVSYNEMKQFVNIHKDAIYDFHLTKTVGSDYRTGDFVPREPMREGLFSMIERRRRNQRRSEQDE